MKSEIITDLMDSVDEIIDAEITAESTVISSMLDSYSKALTILENYDGDSISDFSIFQESFAQEAAVPTDDSETKETAFRRYKEGTTEKESIIMSIIKFIPRVFQMIFNAINKKFDENKIDKLQKNVNAKAKNGPEEIKKTIKKVQGFFNTHGKEIAIGTGALAMATTAGVLTYKRNKIRDELNKQTDIDLTKGTISSWYDINECDEFVKYVETKIMPLANDSAITKDPSKIKQLAASMADFVKNRNASINKKITKAYTYNISTVLDSAKKMRKCADYLKSCFGKGNDGASKDLAVLKTSMSDEEAKSFTNNLNEFQKISMDTTNTLAEFVTIIDKAESIADGTVDGNKADVTQEAATGNATGRLPEIIKLVKDISHGHAELNVEAILSEARDTNSSEEWARAVYKAYMSLSGRDQLQFAANAEEAMNRYDHSLFLKLAKKGD